MARPRRINVTAGLPIIKPVTKKPRAKPPKKKPAPVPRQVVIYTNNKTHLPHPTKSGVVLEPLIDFVEDLLLVKGYRRNRILAAVKEAGYDIAIPTIDRAIREVKDEWLAALERTRSARVSEARRRLDVIVQRAFAGGDLTNARNAVMDMAKLTGDLAPEVKVLLGDGKDPEEYLKQVQELAALAQKEDPHA